MRGPAKQAAGGHTGGAQVEHASACPHIVGQKGSDTVSSVARAAQCARNSFGGLASYGDKFGQVDSDHSGAPTSRACLQAGGRGFGGAARCSLTVQRGERLC